jgi:hypothetical protein
MKDDDEILISKIRLADFIKAAEKLIYTLNGVIAENAGSKEWANMEYVEYLQFYNAKLMTAIVNLCPKCSCGIHNELEGYFWNTKSDQSD